MVATSPVGGNYGCKSHMQPCSHNSAAAYEVTRALSTHSTGNSCSYVKSFHPMLVLLMLLLLHFLLLVQRFVALMLILIDSPAAYLEMHILIASSLLDLLHCCCSTLFILAQHVQRGTPLGELVT